MGDPIEDAKGRAKEAAGAVTGSESLKQEGEAQQQKSEAEEEAARKEREAAEAQEREKRNQ